MKRILPVCLFFAMLAAPEAVFRGAQDGLLLWFRTVFPTLFPFMAVSGIMISTGGLSVISALFGRLSSAVFGTSGNGTFAVLTGFLCGYPAGAKTAADLVREGRITREEGAYLLSFCNNVSPGFVINYIVLNMIGDKKMMMPTMLILNIVPVALSFLFRRIYLKGKKRFTDPGAGHKCGADKFNFAVLDRCLMDSAGSVVKVGLYIIAFSVLISLGELTGKECIVVRSMLPLLEITNGVAMIHDMFPDPGISYPFILGLTSFGGICAAMQTKSMLTGSGISFFPYITQKLAAAAAASLLGFLYIRST